MIIGYFSFITKDWSINTCILMWFSIKNKKNYLWFIWFFFWWSRINEFFWYEIIFWTPLCIRVWGPKNLIINESLKWNVFRKHSLTFFDKPKYPKRYAYICRWIFCTNLTHVSPVPLILNLSLVYYTILYEAFNRNYIEFEI